MCARGQCKQWLLARLVEYRYCLTSNTLHFIEMETQPFWKNDNKHGVHNWKNAIVDMGDEQTQNIYRRLFFPSTF